MGAATLETGWYFRVSLLHCWLKTMKWALVGAALVPHFMVFSQQ